MPSASSSVREFVSTHPEAAEAFLIERYAEQKMALSGDRSSFVFSAHTQVVGAAAIDTVRHSMNARVDVQARGDYYVVRSLGGPVSIAAGTRELRLGAGDLALIGVGRGHRVCWSDARLGLLRLEGNLVHSLLADLGHEPAASALDLCLPQDDLRLRHWLSVLRFVRAAIASTSAPSSLVVHEAARLLTSTTLTTFGIVDDIGCGRGAETTDATTATVRRARSYIENHAAEPITVTDIASAAGVTPRAVQQAFRRHLDTTPTLYVRHVRLECAHRELCRGLTDPDVTVAEVAARWGFGHPGHFASAYRAQFGVPPSTTLRGGAPETSPPAKPKDT